LIFVSLLCSSILTQTVFENSSPQINKDFIARLQNFSHVILNPRESYLAWRARGAQSTSLLPDSSVPDTGSTPPISLDPGTSNPPVPPPNEHHPVTREDHIAQGYTETDPGTGVFAKQVDETTSEISISSDAEFAMRKELVDGVEYTIWYPVAAKAE
jgi:hypothetical protein